MAAIGFPNESKDYREARQQLLEAEIELRAHVERVAVLRRKLPLGGEVAEDYVFQSVNGPRRLSELFAAGKDTLFLYGYMFGPKMKQPCPLCTSFLDSLNGGVHHVEQRINVAVTARSPIERITEVARARGWNRLTLLSDADSTYHRDYWAEAPDGSQLPMANVFVKRGGKIHHTWGSEMLFAPRIEGGDSRHIDMMWPLWNVFDVTPGGRGDFYPKLEY